MREAAIKLAEEGLVSIRARHGITARPELDEQVVKSSMFSALRFRRWRWSAARLSRVEHDHLAALLDRMERHIAGGDIARAGPDLDDGAYSSMVSLCGNGCLQHTLGEYWGQQLARMLILPLRPSPHQSGQGVS